MDVNLQYWIVEYIKVFVSYGFLMFVWPSIVFRKYLRGKSATFRFAFCTTTQVVLINTVVLLLGLVHILNKWTMWFLFYGILIWSLREYFRITDRKKKIFKNLLTGTYGKKNFILMYFGLISKSIKNAGRRLWKFYKEHFIEYTILLITVVYGMLYFSWGAFCDVSYGFGDMYVHHSWIYGLVEGKIFSAGVYPEAMHCVIYSLHTLFGVEIYSCMMYLAGIHIAIILVAMYCFLKEVFHWRYSALFVLVLFLTVDAVCVNGVFSMSRLQWTLPQEYGFHTIYICTLFLLKYLKSEHEAYFSIAKIKFYWDENLVIFVMALAASIAIHFYVTIMAFLICVAFAIVYIHRIINKKHFVTLIFAAMTALLIAIIPMGGALLSGIPFQGSIGWAVSIMNGVDPEAGNKPIAGETVEVVIPDITDDFDNPSVLPNQYAEEENLNIFTPAEPQQKPNLVEKVKGYIKGFTNKIEEKWEIIYHDAYVTLYKSERANLIVFFSVLVLLLSAVYKLLVIILKYILHIKKVPEGLFANYVSMVGASFLFMVIYCAAQLGLPGLVAGARLCSTEQFLVLAVIIIPIDIIFATLAKIIPRVGMHMMSLMAAGGLVAFVYLSGNFHGYLYYELTRYNAAVQIVNEIMNELPKNTYTIVSTTDEIYQVIQDGRHEEILTFCEAQNKGKIYTIPTEYIFIFIEKKPIKYAHNHFFSGPDWLAWERYQDLYAGHSHGVCPDIVCSEISEEKGKESILYFGKPSDSYSDINSRVILESKMYNWCREFEKKYPYELKTYYEDDSYVCYYIRQNTYSLYDLELK